MCLNIMCFALCSSYKTLHIINILFFHEEWGFVLILIYLSGVVSDLGFADGVWSEWGYVQWGFVRLPTSHTHNKYFVFFMKSGVLSSFLFI